MEYDYATGSHSVDSQKLTDIKIRKKLLSDKTPENNVVQQEGKKLKANKEEIKIPTLEEKEKEDKIETKTIALEEESSTIQDTEPKEPPKKDLS